MALEAPRRGVIHVGGFTSLRHVKPVPGRLEPTCLFRRVKHIEPTCLFRDEHESAHLGWKRPTCLFRDVEPVESAPRLEGALHCDVIVSLEVPCPAFFRATPV